MTTPIPEAAVEAALVAYARAINAPAVEWIGTDATEGVKAALTAARPLMEAEALREAADAYIPRQWGRPGIVTGASVWLHNRAATIAERTQR